MMRQRFEYAYIGWAIERSSSRCCYDGGSNDADGVEDNVASAGTQEINLAW